MRQLSEVRAELEEEAEAAPPPPIVVSTDDSMFTRALKRPDTGVALLRETERFIHKILNQECHIDDDDGWHMLALGGRIEEYLFKLDEARRKKK